MSRLRADISAWPTDDGMVLEHRRTHQGVRNVAAEAIEEAATRKNDPADLINVVLERLVEGSVELPVLVVTGSGGKSGFNRCLPLLREPPVPSRAHRMCQPVRSGTGRRTGQGKRPGHGDRGPQAAEPN